MSVDDDSHSLTHPVVGERVILRDAQRGTIEGVALESGEPIYTVRVTDGSRRIVEADGLVRARTYAEWVAPESDWNGEERRKDDRRVGDRRTGERRSPERAVPGRRVAERRRRDRRKP